MLDAFSPAQRVRTLVLLAASASLAGGALAVGIDDDPIGIALAMLSGATLVLAFAHPLRTSVHYWRLVSGSAIAFVVLLVLGIASQVSVDLLAMPRLVEQVLGVVGTAMLLIAGFLFVPAFLVGVFGGLVMRARERGGRADA